MRPRQFGHNTRPGQFDLFFSTSHTLSFNPVFSLAPMSLLLLGSFFASFTRMQSHVDTRIRRDSAAFLFKDSSHSQFEVALVTQELVMFGYERREIETLNLRQFGIDIDF